MPQVPYSGVPSVGPQDNPTPRLQPNVPLDAFGGDVAAATEGLGKQIEGAGNELFTRAMAMQDLFNHSEANQADTDFTIKAGEIHAKLSSMNGKDAVDYFQNGYQSDLQSARADVRGGLSNDMSQKMFDQSSLGTYGRTVFNGASHAAGQNKAYSIGASAATVDGARSMALQNPYDEGQFQQYLKQTEDATRAQWGEGGKGADPETVDNAVRKSTSNLYYDRIATIANKQPSVASAMLDKALADGKIDGDDIGKLQSIVQGKVRTVGARNISANQRSGNDISWGSGVVPIAQAKMGITGAENDGKADYQSLGPTVPGRGQALGRYQIMPENLPEWLGQAGLPSMTPQQFLNSPSAQDKVFETKFGSLMQQYGSFNEAASVWFSGRTIAKAGNVTDATPSSAGHDVPWYLSKANKYLAQNASLEDKVSAGQATATAQYPNDPLMPDYVRQQIVTDNNYTNAIKKQGTFDNNQTIVGGLIGGEDGKLPTTIDELTQKDPKIEAAWNNASNSEKSRYMDVLAKNSKGAQAWDPQGVKLGEYRRLTGMAETDPSGFLDTDIIGTDLPNSAKKELIGLQNAKSKNAEQDPRILHALTLLRPTLEAAQISHKGDADGYNKFVGALQSQMTQFSQDNKTPPKDKDIQEMGQRLLQTQAGTGWFGTSVGANKLFNVDVPDDERSKIVADPYWSSKGIVPTDDMVQRIYTSQMYQKLYGGKPKAQQKLEASAVPVSK